MISVQERIQIPVKDHVLENSWQFSAKISILDVWQCSEYAPGVNIAKRQGLLLVDWSNLGIKCITYVKLPTKYG